MLEAKYILHAVTPGGSPGQPDGSPDRAIREQPPVFRPVRQCYALAFAGKDNRVLSDHAASPEGWQIRQNPVVAHL